MHLRRKGKVPGCKPRSKDRDGESKELRQRQTHYAKGAGLSGDGALNFTHYSPAFSQARYSRRVQEALGFRELVPVGPRAIGHRPGPAADATTPRSLSNACGQTQSLPMLQAEVAIIETGSYQTNCRAETAIYRATGPPTDKAYKNSQHPTKAQKQVSHNHTKTQKSSCANFSETPCLTLNPAP